VSIQPSFVNSFSKTLFTPSFFESCFLKEESTNKYYVYGNVYHLLPKEILALFEYLCRFHPTIKPKMDQMVTTLKAKFNSQRNERKYRQKAKLTEMVHNPRTPPKKLAAAMLVLIDGYLDLKVTEKILSESY